MNVLAAAACVVLLVAVAFRSSSHGTGQRSYSFLCTLPLVLAFLAPIPFALAAAEWSRRLVNALTWGGVGASAAMLLWGIVLIARTRGDRRAVVILALQTGAASIPVVVLTGYWLAFRAF